MNRAALILALLALGACGIDGAPVAPEGAAAPVTQQGVGLTPEKGSI